MSIHAPPPCSLACTKVMASGVIRARSAPLQSEKSFSPDVELTSSKVLRFLSLSLHEGIFINSNRIKFKVTLFQHLSVNKTEPLWNNITIASQAKRAAQQTTFFSNHDSFLKQPAPLTMNTTEHNIIYRLGPPRNAKNVP